MSHLILATRNAHKTREFRGILGPGFVLEDLRAFPDWPEVEETGATFEENAILKARATSRRMAGLVVSDDSGLEVAALGGAPGVHSARYAGAEATDEMNVHKLLDALRDCGSDERRAQFKCVLALAVKGRVVRTLVGAVSGSIVDAPRGKAGFGYDPIFQPDGYAETFAELGAEEKNRISHRAKAIAALREYLREAPTDAD